MAAFPSTKKVCLAAWNSSANIVYHVYCIWNDVSTWSVARIDQRILRICTSHLWLLWLWQQPPHPPVVPTIWGWWSPPIFWEALYFMIFMMLEEEMIEEFRRMLQNLQTCWSTAFFISADLSSWPRVSDPADPHWGLKLGIDAVWESSSGQLGQFLAYPKWHSNRSYWDIH